MDDVNEHSLAGLEGDLAPAQVGPLNDLAREIAEGGPGRLQFIREILAFVGDRWSPLILLVLATGRLRQAGLMRTLHALSGDSRMISQRMLTLKLRALERRGLLERTVSEDVPPKVDYALTASGEELAVHTRTFIDWIKAHGAAHLAATRNTRRARPGSDAPGHRRAG